jgi:Phage portal protein, SPP1 Gp6-like
MTQETRESWQHFQRRSRTNWGELIVDSCVDRLKPTGITVNGNPNHPAAKKAQNIWRFNRMDGVFKEWVRYGLTFGQSYLTCWGGGEADTAQYPVITADSPETMCVITNPLRHWVVESAVRVYRHEDEAKDYANIWTPNAFQMYERDTYTRIELRVIPSKWLVNLAEGAWRPISGLGGGLDTIPVVVYNNPGGHGDYETHIDLINRINVGVLERLVIAAMQAFRQRAITGGQLPERDINGNQIDYTRVFAPAPGALWNLPKDLEIWESQPMELTSLLAASMADIRTLSALAKVPLPMLIPDNTNTSAEGAKNTDAGFLARCCDRLTEAKLGLQEILYIALRVAGMPLDPEKDILEVTFESPDRITVQEKYGAALAAHNAGESWRSIERNILSYSPAQIEQDESDRAHEAMLAATLPAIPTNVQERLVGTPEGPDAAPAGDSVPGAPKAGDTSAQSTTPRQPAATPGAKKPPSTLGGNQASKADYAPGGNRKR